MPYYRSCIIENSLSTHPPPLFTPQAVDAAHNTQPENAKSVWNLRGLANNSWHRVPLALVED